MKSEALASRRVFERGLKLYTEAGGISLNHRTWNMIRP
jgi:hypothetical protein